MIAYIPNLKDYNGCFVLVQGESFVSQSIIRHNNVLARVLKKPKVPYSHAEFLLWDEAKQQLFTIGAREGGTEISRVQDYYGSKKILVFRPDQPLLDDETVRAWLYYETIKDKKYQYGALAAWIHYIKVVALEQAFNIRLPGKWIAKQGDHRNYCYELLARFLRIVGKWPEGKDLDVVSIFDLVEVPRYTKVEDCLIEGPTGSMWSMLT